MGCIQESAPAHVSCEGGAATPDAGRECTNSVLLSAVRWKLLMLWFVSGGNETVQREVEDNGSGFNKSTCTSSPSYLEP